MDNETLSINQKDSIRRHFDENSQKWHYSIVDVINIVAKSSDARNYWKVLKNRLKNAQNKLVTECNQLKMRASDGKFYLTDTAERDTMLKIIKIVAPENIFPLREYFDSLERNKSPDIASMLDASNPAIDNENDSYPQEELAPMIDAYHAGDSLVVETMLAGVPIEDILVSATNKILTIEGTREGPRNISGENYLNQELCWGKFSRSIPLPDEIEIDNIVATCHFGMLRIKMQKIGKSSAKIIAVKII